MRSILTREMVQSTIGTILKMGMCNFKSKGTWSMILVTLMLGFYTGFQIMYTPVHMRICPDPIEAPKFYNNKDNITIVTMYLNIGSLHKTSFLFFAHTHYTTDTYKQWLVSWGKLSNKVIAFFDDDKFITQFRLLRKHLPESHTKIIKVDRDMLKAFEKMDRIGEIIKDPAYKTTYPPTYTCVMNAKYDALEMALALPDMQSEYIAWMDIGLFRRLESTVPPFTLKVPPGFNDSTIGVSEVSPRSELDGLSPLEIYQKNKVWVAGGYILAKRELLPKFIAQYRAATDTLLDMNLADTDQQVLGSMYSPQLVKQQSVFLSPFACPRGAFGLFGHGYLYFCLPYMCKATAECHVNYQANKVSLASFNEVKVDRYR